MRIRNEMTSITENALKNEWLKVGTVGPAHGIKGCFFCYTSDRRSEEIDYSELFIKSAEFPEKSGVVKVTASYLSGGRPVLAIENCLSREDVEMLLGAELYVAKKTADLEENEFYVGDLIGVDIECPKGKKRGSVIAVHDFGAQVNLEIELTAQDSSQEKSESQTSSKSNFLQPKSSTVLFPFLKQFIIFHDLESKNIVVENFDMFLEN